jgi:hypothetical protein
MHFECRIEASTKFRDAGDRNLFDFAGSYQRKLLAPFGQDARFRCQLDHVWPLPQNANTSSLGNQENVRSR